MDPKESAGRAAAARVEPGMTLGLGTGSTVRWLIEELATRHSQGLSFTVVPTSRQTAELAAEYNIPLTDINTIEKLPLTIDGADEIDPSGHLIKGGGGALLREKIVAAASDYLLIIADEKSLYQHWDSFLCQLRLFLLVTARYRINCSGRAFLPRLSCARQVSVLL